MRLALRALQTKLPYWLIKPCNVHEDCLQHESVQAMGNLTIVTQKVNFAQSHSVWKDKKPALAMVSTVIGASYQAASRLRVTSVYGACRHALTLWSH
jgi:hypothetical protein